MTAAAPKCRHDVQREARRSSYNQSLQTRGRYKDVETNGAGVGAGGVELEDARSNKSMQASAVELVETGLWPVAVCINAPPDLKR